MKSTIAHDCTGVEEYDYGTHEFKVGDEVLILIPIDGEFGDSDYDYLPGKLLKIYKGTPPFAGTGIMGDVKVYKFNKVLDGEFGYAILPIWTFDKPKKFLARFMYSHRADDEHEFTARSEEEVKDKFEKWAADMECSEDFDFEFLDAEEVE